MSRGVENCQPHVYIHPVSLQTFNNTYKCKVKTIEKEGNA